MGDGAVAEAVQPEFQMLQLQDLAVRDGDQMDGREIWVLGARTKTGELGEALVEDLAMSLRSRPDLPGRGIRRCCDRFAAVFPALHVRLPTSDLASDNDLPTPFRHRARRRPPCGSPRRRAGRHRRWPRL